MDVTIRRAQPQDSDEISRVHKASVTELCRDSYSPEQIEAWVGRPPNPRVYERLMGEAIVFVAEDGDELVAYSVMTADRDRIGALYVRPEHARRGIGTRLLAELETEARSAAVSAVTLNATPNSVAFYESCGFSSLDEGSHTFSNGLTLACVRMEKRL